VGLFAVPVGINSGIEHLASSLFTDAVRCTKI